MWGWGFASASIGICFISAIWQLVRMLRFFEFSDASHWRDQKIYKQITEDAMYTCFEYSTERIKGYVVDQLQICFNLRKNPKEQLQEIESYLETELNERQNHERFKESTFEATVIKDNISKLFALAGVNLDGESDGSNSARSNDQLDQSRKSESFEQINSINRSVTRKGWDDPSRISRDDLETGPG